MVINLPHDTHTINATHYENIFCVKYAFFFQNVFSTQDSSGFCLHWFTSCNAAYSGFYKSRFVREMMAHFDLPLYRASCHAFLSAIGSNYVALLLFTFCLSAFGWSHPVMYTVSLAIAVFWLWKRFTDTKHSFILNVMNQPDCGMTWNVNMPFKWNEKFNVYGIYVSHLCAYLKNTFTAVFKSCRKWEWI